MIKTDARLSSTLRIENFTLKITDDLSLHNLYQFDVDAQFELVRYKKSLDCEQPDDEDYCEIFTLKIVDRAFLSDGKGYMLSITPQANLFDILSQEQYEKLCDYIMLYQTEGIKL